MLRPLRSLAGILAEAGPGKLLYGTDAPYQSPRVESQKVLDATSDPDVRHAVFYENALKVWRLESR